MDEASLSHTKRDCKYHVVFLPRLTGAPNACVLSVMGTQTADLFPGSTARIIGALSFRDSW